MVSETPVNSNGPGQVIVLNGVPRSGKSSIVKAIQETYDGIWMNLGVDVFCRLVTPEEYQPGIGLRPGGERPDLEPLIVASYVAMYESIAAHSRQGLNVIVDVGHHDGYSKPLGILPRCARCLDDLPVLFIGVHCSLDEIMRRRKVSAGNYEAGTSDEPYPAPVRRWLDHVHTGVKYDLELDTTSLEPTRCAELIRERLDSGTPGTAFHQLAEL